MVEELITAIIGCAREVAEREGITLPADFGADTRLFGRQGLFDSLGLVSLVVSVEEAIEDRFGAVVSLADERAMSQARSPFRTVRALAEYASGLIEAPAAGAQ